jgi:GntR family transcriptional repressor for pyruvate dehydrogenase complex
VNQIKNLISEGILKPGDQLPSERELVKELKVSRTALREALKCLTTAGLLELTETKRTFVKSVVSEGLQHPLSLLVGANTARIYDLIEIRRELEGWNAFHAATRATTADIERLNAIIEEMKEAIRKSRSWEKEDADFHLAIAQAAHNVIRAHVMFTIYDLLAQSVKKVFADRSDDRELLDHHDRIFAAIKNHSPEEARSAILEHLHYVESKVRTSVNNGEAD